MPMARTYCVETAIRGYHVYGAVWEVWLGEVLYCEGELDNHENEFAVAVKLQDRSRTTVDHILRELSRLACYFIRRGAHITCKVTGQRTSSRSFKADSRFLVLRSSLCLQRIIHCYRDLLNSSVTHYWSSTTS